MHLSGHLCIYTVYLVLICLCNGVEGEDRRESGSLVTIDAAFSSWQARSFYLTLISGNQFLLVDGNREWFTADGKEIFVPDDMHVQAAFLKDPEKPHLINYYADKYGVFINAESETAKAKRLKYGPRRAFIRKGGPDAIGRRNDVVYVFKGCKMAIRHSWDKWELALNDVKTIGLPCNADAAWGEMEGAMVVLKGDQVWRWETDDSVNGPHAFHDTYHLDSWTLKPSEESK